MEYVTRLTKRSGKKQYGFGVDIAPEFLGFVSSYKMLSYLIPKNYTVVDLGCAYAPQSYYFKDHKKYIGVDVYDGFRFLSDNSEKIINTIDWFVNSEIYKNLNLSETFAINNYVPNVNQKKLNCYFKNIYSYYPNSERKASIGG